MNKIGTMGSLFDGSGGFPYASILCGIEPMWASEIEKFPIAVTSKRFPNMKHLGDIRHLDGGKIPPVDVITFGSPCTALSIAGKREGLHRGQSSLFFEAVRIIREMRKSTNGKYPTFIVWENVFGALSSGHERGRDFQTVLSEIAQAPVPMPLHNKWANAGMVVSDGISVAYRVLSAQFWGVPQRRRRIYLVGTFGKQCAGKILFERGGLSRDFTPRGKAGKGTAGSSQKRPATPKLLTLRAGCDGGGKGALVSDNMSLTLSTGNTQTLFAPQNIVLNDQGGDSINVCHGICPTLRAEAHGNLPCVLHPDITGTLCGSGAGTSRPAGNCNETDFCIVYALQGNTIDRSDTAGANGKGVLTNQCYTLNTCDRHAIAYDCRNDRAQEISGTLQSKSTGGYSLNYINPVAVNGGENYIVRRLTPTECAKLQGFPPCWCADIPHSGSAEYKLWGNGIALPCALYVMEGIAEELRKENGLSATE